MQFKKFSNYYDLGFSVMPVRGKLPLLSWKKWQKERPLPEQVEAWDRTNHNIGIITGKVSGIVVVDVDGETDKEFTPTWTVKTSKGFHYYFNYQPIGNRARIAENIDIRGEGGYVVAPPSRHESGHVYEWVRDPSTEIADLPDWVLAAQEKEKPILLSQPARIILNETNEPYIQAAIDGEASALRNAIEGTRNDQLNRSAFALAQLMSAGQVKSILQPIALSIGLNAIEVEKTLNSAIKSAVPRDIPAIEVPDGDCPLVRSIIEKHGRKITHAEVAPAVIDQAPGMIGQLVKWILETSLYPQPVLALAAAIPAIGNIMAHRVRTETNLRTNFYTLGIAESGAGKEHARRCIARLYEHTNLSDTILGDPASAVAVINAVKRAQGRGVMMIDEFGRFLEATKGRNAASHTKMITTNMMYLFNAAGDTFTGQEYANNDMAGGRSDIVNPCLGIYATTVSSRFYGAISAEDTFDGFLSRWLVFETKRFDIEPSFNAVKSAPPESLIDEIRHWQAINTQTLTGYDPAIISFRDRGAYHAYIRDCRARMAGSDNPVAKAFWNRAAEHAAKIALCGHTGNDIDPATFDWAVQLVNAQTQAMIDNIGQNLSENTYEADLKRVLAIISEPLTRSEITRKTQWLDRRRRNDILDNLIEAGRIASEKQDQDGGKSVTIYRPSGF